jgi:hypothetical protein
VRVLVVIQEKLFQTGSLNKGMEDGGLPDPTCRPIRNSKLKLDTGLFAFAFRGS